jgi:phosphatidylglycerophosphatase A
MKPNIELSAGPAARKPRFALFLATAFGLGYLPKAPGTFGSLFGIAVAIAAHPVSLFVLISTLFFHSGLGLDIPVFRGHPAPALLLVPSLLVLLVVALVGVWTSSRVATYAGAKDPQHVVIDEVSGMHLTLVLGIMPLGLPSRLLLPDEAAPFALYAGFSLLNWKYLLAGFILFRVFDIWKPFPVRQAESLPGGWGIMADDWVAAIYAALGLWLLRWMGL